MITIFSLLNEEGRNRKKSGGGSGKPLMQVQGRQSGLRMRNARGQGVRPRGYLSTRGTFVQAVVKSKFVMRNSDSQRHIIQHVDYIAERNQKPWEDRKFFNKERFDVDRDDVIHHISTHQGSEVSMHKMILSPGDNSVNLVTYTRESMDKLEQALGYEIDWYAVEHSNTDHYHAHVVIAGKIPEQERKSQEEDRNLGKYLDDWAKHMEGRDLKLYRYNFDTLREAGNDFLLRERSIDRALDQAIEKELGLHNWTYDKYIEQELGLITSNQDYLTQKLLGLNTRETDREIAKEFGFGKTYDLGRIFELDRDGKLLYELANERTDSAPQKGDCDQLGMELHQELVAPTSQQLGSDEKACKERELSMFAFDLSNHNHDEADRNQFEEQLSSELYQHQNQEHEHLNEIEMNMFESNGSDNDRGREDEEGRDRGDMT